MKNRRFRLTALLLLWFLWDVKEPTLLFEKITGRKPRLVVWSTSSGMDGISVRTHLNQILALLCVPHRMVEVIYKL